MKKLSVISSYYFFGHFHTNDSPILGTTVLGTEFDFPTPTSYSGRGGKGHYVAQCCHSIGCDVDLILKIGDDALGDIVYQECKEYGFQTEHIFRDANTKTGQGIGIEKDKEWAWMVYPEANYLFTKDDIDRCADSIRASAAISAQMEVNIDAVEYAFEIAQQADVRTIFDAAPALPVPDSLLQKCSIIKPNQFEAEVLTGIKITNKESAIAAAQYFLSHGVKEAAIITLGGDGLVYATPEKSEWLPPIKVPVVELSSAGDTTCAGLMIATALGGSIDTAVRFAQCMAAIHVSGIPCEQVTLKMVRDMYEKHYGPLPFPL